MTEPKAELPLGNAPGVAPERIPELEKAAVEYDVAKKDRMEHTKIEVAAKKKVSDLLKKYEKQLGRDPKGAMHYKCDDPKMKIDLTPTDEKLKVKIGDAEEEAEPEE